jgi:hypothetical protein
VRWQTGVIGFAASRLKVSSDGLGVRFTPKTVLSSWPEACCERPALGHAAAILLLAHRHMHGRWMSMDLSSSGLGLDNPP